MRTLFVIFALFFMVLTSCNRINRTTYNIGTFPDQPVNFGGINSEFDDYNSASPIIGSFIPLCFSSSRNSQGKNFDIVYKFLDVNMNRETGILSVGEDTDNTWGVFSAEYATLFNALSVINTSYNEYGPYFIPDSRNGYRTDPLLIFLYSSNENGNQDIRYVHNLDASGSFTSPKPVTWLNSAKDDAYPTLVPDSSAICFCSDRGGDYDIYKVILDQHKSLRMNIEDTATKPVSKEEILSSSADDKCPFIMGKLMVFTSDRAGGFGGFDLYYSVFRDSEWSEPVNFGEKINTPYDEYRPVVIPFMEFTNDFMIFSSNRPGGKGGFDLYYVGVERLSAE